MHVYFKFVFLKLECPAYFNYIIFVFLLLFVNTTKPTSKGANVDQVQIKHLDVIGAKVNWKSRHRLCVIASGKLNKNKLSTNVSNVTLILCCKYHITE